MDRCFYFPTLPIYCSYFTSGKLSRPRYQQKWNKIMKISQEDVILIKNLYLSGTRRVLSELPVKGWKLGSIDSLLKRSRKTGTMSRNQAPLDRVCRVAVEDLVLSQEDKPKRHRWAREISHETAILYSSVHRKIIHHDLQLTCFKRRRAQLLSEANRISRLTHW